MSSTFCDTQRLRLHLSELRSAQQLAERAFDEAYGPYLDEDDRADANAIWRIELVFHKLMILAEHLGLPLFRTTVAESFAAALADSNGLLNSVALDGEHYSVALGKTRQFLFALETLSGPTETSVVTKQVTDILRSCVYPITDSALFSNPPRNEADVHARIEGILKCVFPDLKRKPTLTKPIKNFEPDTGLPSIRTLLEYKFMSSATDAPRIADEILADTRGYHSSDYDNFVYVIYETERFRQEVEWFNLLEAADISSRNTSIIVLSGIPATSTSAKKITSGPGKGAV